MKKSTIILSVLSLIVMGQATANNQYPNNYQDDNNQGYTYRPSRGYYYFPDQDNIARETYYYYGDQQNKQGNSQSTADPTFFAGEAFATDQDRQIIIQIRDVFKRQSDADLSHVNIRIDNGNVTITGQVNNPQEKQQILTLIRNARGVKNIQDNVSVMNQSATPQYQGRQFQGQQPQSEPTFRQQIRERAQTFARQFQNQDNQQQTEFDQRLVQKIRDSLSRDPSTMSSANSITIQSQNGFITITGHVNNPNEQSQIISRIKSISGVQDVDDQLVTRTQSQGSSNWWNY